MELFDAIQQRHSFRSYRSDPVPREMLDRIIRAAARAPSAGNEQPWRFYVATGNALARLIEIMSQSTQYLEDFLSVLGHQATADQLTWYSELGGAPVVIVCTIPEGEDGLLLLNKHLAVGAAVENLLLAATALGLGTCSVTFSYWVSDQVAEVLGIPGDQRIVAMVTVGFPADAPPLAPPRETDIAVFLD